MSSSAGPLDGLTIAVTRPRAQAAELARGIELAGGRVRALPLLTIDPVPLTPALQAQLARLAGVDWLVFVSPNAVRFGLELMAAAGVALSPQVRLAAVGQGSTRALHAQGWHDVRVPAERQDSEGLLALPELAAVRGQRIVILRGDGGRALLGDTLAARGAEVEYLTCYLRGTPPLDVPALLADPPDVLTVTSSEALDHLWQQLGDEGQTALAAMPLLLPHPRIAERARQQGWHQVLTCAGGDDGLLAGLIAWAKTRNHA